MEHPELNQYEVEKREDEQQNLTGVRHYLLDPPIGPFATREEALAAAKALADLRGLRDDIA